MTVVQTKDATVNIGNSTLMIHAGGGMVSREFLQTIEKPVSRGSKHKPVPFDIVLDNAERALNVLNRPMIPDTMQIALSNNAQRMFMIVQVEGEELISGEAGLVLGLQSSTDCTIANKANIGANLFVCDNLCFQGGEFVFRKKSTKNLNLTMALFMGLEEFFEKGNHIKALIENARSTKVSEEGAKALFWDTFTRRLVPQKFFKPASDYYFEGQHEEIKAPECDQYRGTLWGVHNAFTRALKAAPLTQRYGHTKNLGELLTLN